MKDAAAAIIADVAAVITVDVVMETACLEILPAAVFSGSSALCAFVEIMAAVITAVVMEMIPAGSLLYCFFFAVDAEIMVVAAELSHGAEVNSSAFSYALFLSVRLWKYQKLLAFSGAFSCIPDQFHKKHCHPVQVFLSYYPCNSSF